MAAKGLQLTEGGDFVALHCQPSRNFDRSIKLDLTTEPPLLGRCCYLLPFALFFFILLFLSNCPKGIKPQIVGLPFVILQISFV
jgi:hypothetical protein